MALEACEECGKPVSTSAKMCPHCGRKEPGLIEELGNIVSCWFGCAGLVIAVALLSALFSWMFGC